MKRNKEPKKINNCYYCINRHTNVYSDPCKHCYPWYGNGFVGPIGKTPLKYKNFAPIAYGLGQSTEESKIADILASAPKDLDPLNEGVSEDFKKWVSGLAGYDFSDSKTNYWGKLNFPNGDFNCAEYYKSNTLEILVKAKWKLDEIAKKNCYDKNSLYIRYEDMYDKYPAYHVSCEGELCEEFPIKGNRQRALEAALIYVMENSK